MQAVAYGPNSVQYFQWRSWAIEQSCGPRNEGMHYLQTVKAHHEALWRLGIPTDVADMECDMGGYSLVIAPMLYMYRAGMEGKLRRFVENGGTLVGTY